jgi:SPP1 gp7 family putative phage head morphogenesis protein
MPTRRERDRNEKVLPAVHPNAGYEALLRRKLLDLIDEMAHSYFYWLRATYRAHKPVMAQDEIPARELERALNRLGKRWEKRFNEAAPELARYFATAIERRSSANLRQILRKGGITVRWQMTKLMRDAVEASIAENVGLIRSIPQQYHTQVQTAVMEAVKSGRQLDRLAKELRDRYQLTRKRAAFVARDQVNKMTAVTTRARQEEAGIEWAVWLHSHAGKKPRKTHLANSGQRYRIADGWLDPDPKVRKRIWPGQLPNCRCVSKSIVRGFS